MAAMKNDTFKKIKKMIKDLTRRTPKKYHLIFKGKPCDDYLTLGALAINDGDIVHMVPTKTNIKHISLETINTNLQTIITNNYFAFYLSSAEAVWRCRGKKGAR